MRSSKIRVAFCSNGIFPHAVGGMQRHSKLLIETLSSLYKDLHITVYHPHKSGIFDDFENIEEVSILGIDENKPYLWERYRYSQRIFDHLQEFSGHIIYSQGPSVWYGIEKLSAPVVINPHGLEPFQVLSLKDKITHYPFKVALTRLFKKAEYTISLGGQLTDILKRAIDESKIVTLPNAVSASLINRETNAKPQNKENIQLLFVGRFASNKGIHNLIEAIAQLNTEGYTDKINFKLAGKGPLYDTYNEKYNFENVDFLGFVSDEQLEDLYETSDLFVLPTLFEGMPTVVLEAMAHGLPIIVTDVGATAELVDESNGYLIEKDNVFQLKESIKQFYELPSDKKYHLGQRSVKKVEERFTWEKVAEQHVEFFENII